MKHSASHERRRSVFIFIARVYPGGKGGNTSRLGDMCVKGWGRGSGIVCGTGDLEDMFLGATEGTKA